MTASQNAAVPPFQDGSEGELMGNSSERAGHDVAIDPNGKLAIAIANGKAEGKAALYFGCRQGPGHYLQTTSGKTIWDTREVPGLSWGLSHMDGGLLKNGQRADVCDGKVFWTCGGLSFWYAFYWWDRSIDKRSGSNSGLYVRGFGWPEAQEAFDYACQQFPSVVARQKHPLVLQTPTRIKGTAA